MTEVNEHELFLKSHAVLMDLARCLNAPRFIIPKNSGIQIQELIGGDTIIIEDPKGAVRAIPSHIPPDMANKVIESFLDSHRRLDLSPESTELYTGKCPRCDTPIGQHHEPSCPFVNPPKRKM